MNRDAQTARHYEASHVGRVRSNNQDKVLIDETLGLWVVADGMGGHTGGAEASRLACEAVRESIIHGMPLVDAFEVAHSRVRSAQELSSAVRDMGTTLIAVKERDGGFDLAWVGDSRAYRVNARREEFERLTHDHNVAGRLYESGAITADEARDHPQRHILTDCIGQRDRLPTIDSRRFEWHPGDRLLLCSDGLTGEVPDAEIARWLAAGHPPSVAGDKLVSLALDAGGRDNISLIVLDTPV